MKIKDVIISESPAGTAYQHNMSAQDWRDYAALQKQPAVDPNNYVKKDPAPKKKVPKKQAPKKPVDAMANSNAGDQTTSSYTGQAPTMSDRAADPNVAGVAKAPEADPSIDPYDPTKDTNVTQVADPGGTTAELDRLKQLAIGGTQPAPAAPAPVQGAGTGMAGNTTTPPPNANPLGVTAQSGAAFGQPVPQADNPNPPSGQAAQPRDASTVPDAAKGVATSPQVSPDTGLSTAPKPVTTSTGGKTNITTGSDDEMAWRSKQTGIVDVSKYPGAGNWDPKTGRTKQDPNKPGFFDKLFGKKTAPAPAAPAPAQQAQPMVPPGFAESNGELDLIRKLSGLR